MGMLRDLTSDIWFGPQLTRSDFPAVSPPSVQVSGLSSLLGWGPDTQLTSRRLLSIPAVCSTLDLIAAVGASFPVVTEAPDGTVLRGDDMPRVVARPTPGQTRYQSVYDWLFNLGLSGRLWWHRILVGGGPLGLEMIPPSRVHARYESPQSTRIVYQWNGQPTDPNLLRQIYWFRDAEDAQGTGPLQTNSDVLQAIIGANRRALSVFTDDSTPPFVLTTPQPLSPRQAEENMDRFEARHRGRDRAALLTGGLDAKVLQHDNRGQQWDEARQFGVLEVGRMFHFPEVLLLASSGGSSITYQNVSQVAINLLRFAVQPFLDRLENAWSDQLDPGWTVRFDTSTFNRADITTRFNAYAVASGNAPWLDPAMIQQWEGVDRPGETTFGMTEGIAQ